MAFNGACCQITNVLLGRFLLLGSLRCTLVFSWLLLSFSYDIRRCRWLRCAYPTSSLRVVASHLLLSPSCYCLSGYSKSLCLGTSLLRRNYFLVLMSYKFGLSHRAWASVILQPSFAQRVSKRILAQNHLTEERDLSWTEMMLHNQRKTPFAHFSFGYRFLKFSRCIVVGRSNSLFE